MKLATPFVLDSTMNRRIALMLPWQYQVSQLLRLKPLLKRMQWRTLCWSKKYYNLLLLLNCVDTVRMGNALREKFLGFGITYLIHINFSYVLPQDINGQNSKS